MKQQQTACWVKTSPLPHIHCVSVQRADKQGQIFYWLIIVLFNSPVSNPLFKSFDLQEVSKLFFYMSVPQKIDQFYQHKWLRGWPSVAASASPRSREISSRRVTNGINCLRSCLFTTQYPANILYRNYFSTILETKSVLLKNGQCKPAVF